jgi:hypothetical protein
MEINPFTAPQKLLPTTFFHNAHHLHYLQLTKNMPTALVINRLLCSLLDELDQTKPGIHSLDV